MLKHRIITALILGPILLAAIIYGNHDIFAFAIFIIQSAAVYEWLKINKLKTSLAIVNAILISFLSLFIADQLNISDHVATQFIQPLHLYAVIAIYSLVWLMALLWLKNYRWGYENTPKQTVVKSITGVVAIMLFGLTINELYGFGEGRWMTLVLFFLIWVADIGAYVSGKTMGKHKLAINISPGKTWEGVIGASLFVMIFAVIVAPYIELLWWQAILIFVPVAWFSVVGDLAASLAKRQAEIKDSSNLLPGHGGFIDRFDSLIAAAPLYTFLIIYVS